MKYMQGKPEILAPAGSLESLKGAVAAGADAVYIGGNRFGARAFADNPDTDDLLWAIDYVHSKDRRIYLTVNTLLKEKELSSELAPFLEKYYKAGVDAVIVQDVGVLHFLASRFPELPLHASTQMTLVSADGAKMLSEYPVTRLVPARELSFEEIKQIRANTELEMECFVHGALCYCYSGQCLLSSMIGGRSGNRGRCAQPCRMAYEVTEDGKRIADGLYALSPKDLCTLDKIPELVHAGIDSFKIEGRMKRPEYTAGVTAAYRLLTDLYFGYGEAEFYQYLKKHPEVLREQTDRVADLYNRGGFTKGYYVQHHGKDMMSMERPNHTGTLVGEVVSGKGIRAKIKLDKALNPQDVLEIRDVLGESYEFTAGKSGIEENPGWYETNVKKGFSIVPGQQVFRTKNESLLTELSTNYVEKQVQMPVEARFTAILGEPAALTVSYTAHQRSSLVPGADIDNTRIITVTATGDVIQEAQNQPVTEAKIREQLNKTGESEFTFEKLDILTEGNIFLPMGKIKELRRNAFEQLKQEILFGYRRPQPGDAAVCAERNGIDFADDGAIMEETENVTMSAPQTQEIITLVSTEEQCRFAMNQEQVTTVYVDVPGGVYKMSLALCKEVKQAGKKAFLVLPHIFREKEKKAYESVREVLDVDVLDGFLAKSLEELAFLKEIDPEGKFEVRLNYNLYVFQQKAKRFFEKKGLHRFTVPVELNEEEIRELGVSDCDFIVYGRLPVMVSAQCVRDNVLHCQSGKKIGGIVLKDRMGAEFPVMQRCDFCYNVIYNSAVFSLLGTGAEEKFAPAGWRFDFTMESRSEMEQVLEAFLSGSSYSGKEPYTKGHFKRGIE